MFQNFGDVIHRTKRRGVNRGVARFKGDLADLEDFANLGFALLGGRQPGDGIEFFFIGDVDAVISAFAQLVGQREATVVFASLLPVSPVTSSRSGVTVTEPLASEAIASSPVKTRVAQLAGRVSSRRAAV